MEDWSRVVAESCASGLLLGLHLGEVAQAQMGSSPENQHPGVFLPAARSIRGAPTLAGRGTVLGRTS